MKAISLFSGIGGFDLGFERAGIETMLQVEQDKHCLAVLERHWPGVERLTDVRDVRRGDADLIYGGFPCQDVSVAGARAGLAGERSGLWFEFERIVRELRPRWAVIENVPGLLSSNGGRDFAVILYGLGQLGYVVGWGVLDAQHFGVPQRRRRVFIVAGTRKRSIEQILSLCESCGGNPSPGGETRQDVASSIAASLGHHGRSSPRGDGSDNLIAGTLGGPSSSGGYRSDLDTNGAFVIQDVRGARDKKENGIGIAEGGPMYTLDGTSQHGVYVPEIVGALTNGAPGGGLNGQDVYFGRVLAPPLGVRRLTPTECERLQGFPDGWTAGQSDTHRYRQLGNAVAVPVAEYIGRRLMNAPYEEETK